MAKPTLESLKEDFERQEQELAELMERLACCDPRDIPQSFFVELDEACEPKQLAWSGTVETFNPFGLRA